MHFLKQHWDKLLLGLAILAYAITFSTLNILRHNAFASGLDLGNMDQTVWNTLHGRFFTLTTEAGTVSRFAHHGDLLLIFFAPLYAFWSSPHILNIVESLYLALGAIPTYLIARHILKHKGLALFIVALYLLSPLLEWVDIFDFHSVSFAIPTLLAAFYCILTKKWKWYWVFIALALITKEQISLQIVVLGLIITLIYKEKRVGLLTSAIGIVWFIIMIFVVIPYFSPAGKHWAFEWFQLGNSLGEIIQNSVQRFLFDPEIRTYYGLLLKSYGFLPIFGFPWLILALPDLVINILSSHSEMHSIKYHYSAGLIPGLTIASIYGLHYFRKATKKFHDWPVFVIVLTAFLILLRTNYHHSPLPTTAACWCISYQVSDDDREFEKVLQAIPLDKSVTASTEIHAHVTHREHSYLLPYATQSADFIALIDQNRIIDNYGPKPYEKGLIQKLNTGGEYEIVKHIGHFFLYKKSSL